MIGSQYQIKELLFGMLWKHLVTQILREICQRRVENLWILAWPLVKTPINCLRKSYSPFPGSEIPFEKAALTRILLI